MPTPINVAKNLAARAARLPGWEVEEGNGRQDWRWRITAPNGTRIQLHSSPSDVNWQNKVMRDLNRAGFSADEAAYEESRKQEILERANAERELNEKRLADAQKRAGLLARAAGPFGPQVAKVDWIFRAHDLPETKRCLITPELAMKILDELNTANRPLRLGRVNYWAKVIRQDRWKYTHQGVAFDTLGRLQDGQHRLAAAMQENYTLDINVSVGMPVENFGIVDVGAGRTGADTLAVNGGQYVATTSGAIRHIVVYELFGGEMRSGLKNRISNDIIAEKEQEFGEYLAWAVKKAEDIYYTKSSPKMSKVAMATGIYLIGNRLPKDDERLEEFLRGYTEGTELAAGDIRHVLRDFMFSLKADTRRMSTPVVDQLAVFVKAWNLWVQGKTQQTLGWRKNELFPKPFLPPRD